jgi:hypothetical protein
MDQIRSAEMPVGFGLIFVDARRPEENVVQVENPRFAWPLPLDDAEAPMRLLVIGEDLRAQVVADLNAVEIPSLGRDWYRFGIWEKE